MKTNTRIVLAAATLSLASAVHAENGVELFQSIMSQTNHTLIPTLEWRARYEYGEQDGLDPAHAATLRARAGLQSQDYSGFSGLIEFEATRALDTSSYRAANVHGDPANTVIADPESTELNRAQLQFKRNNNLIIGGRQRIILDNARFVGNVGWRQNEQTYDAVSYKNTMVKDLSLYYAYISRVNRIFGSGAPKGTPTDDFDSDSSLFNVSYSGIEGMKLTGYAYLLDFDNAPGVTANTYGLSCAVKGAIAEGYTAEGYAEFALQEGAGDNVDYTAPYFHLKGKVAREGYSALLGLEMLGTDDDTIGFSTPLATAHAFNGWNDQFLGTPPAGLKDFYAGMGLPCIPKIPVTLIYHYFTSADGGESYGNEFDAVASRKISAKMKAIAKFSYYDADELKADRTRFSLELDYKY